MGKNERKRLPIGISNFKEIIENNYYYVDKTNFIENILEEGFKVELFTRPRRFGKTLNISMLNYFFNIENKEPNLEEWKKMVQTYYNPEKEITIALVGKYVELPDAYLSVAEALTAAGIYHKTSIKLIWIDSKKIETKEDAAAFLKDADGIIVPGGFGDRGINGMLLTAQFARENKIPYFGICLGMQCSVIEFARNVIGYKDANSSEMNPKTTHPVIDIMSDQKNIGNMGGTMRLGSYPCRLEENSKAFEVYHEKMIAERHRHRYEFNNAYIDDFTKHGMVATGRNPERDLVEIVEIHEHPWFIGVQFHPEYKSTVAKPHPLFVGFIKAALENSKK